MHISFGLRIFMALGIENLSTEAVIWAQSTAVVECQGYHPQLPAVKTNNRPFRL